MSAGLGTLKAYLSADVTGWTSGLNRALSSVSAFKVAAIGAMGAAAGAVTALGMKGLKEFYRQDAQLNRIGGLLKASEFISGMTSKAVAADAARMSAAFGMTETEVMKLQARMLSFPNIGREMVGRATSGAINMAAGLGKDPASMATALARALQDPLKGITLLKRHIGAFTEEEKTAIRNALMMGDVFKAQEVIMGKIESRFKGVRDVMVTPWEHIKAAWPEILEGAGKFLEYLLDFQSNGKNIGETIREWGKWIQDNALAGAVFIKTFWARLVWIKNQLFTVGKWIFEAWLGWGTYAWMRVGAQAEAIFTNIKTIIGNLGEWLYVTLVNALRKVQQWAIAFAPKLMGMLGISGVGPEAVFKAKEINSWLPKETDEAKVWRDQIPGFTELFAEMAKNNKTFDATVDKLEKWASDIRNRSGQRDIDEQKGARGKAGANQVDWESLYQLPRGLFQKFGKQPDRPEFAQLAEYGSVEAYRLQYGRNEELVQLTEQIAINTENTADATEDMAEAQERIADALEEGQDEGVDVN